MKKLFIASVISAIVPVMSQATVVYEKPDQTLELTGRMEYDAGRLANGQNNGGEGTARLGVKGKQATGYDNISLIMRLEWQVSGESDQTADSKFNNRHAFAGLDFGNGFQTIWGHTDTPLKQLTDITDIFDYWGTASVNYPSTQGVYLGMQRMNDMLMTTYQANNWTLGASYSASDDKKTETSSTTGTIFKDHYSALAGYTFTNIGLKVLAGYQQANYEDATTNASSEASQYGIGIGYTHNAFYAGTNLHQYKALNGDHTNLMEFSTSYKFTPRWALLVGYAYGHNSAEDEDVVKESTFDVQYTLNPRTKAYAVYRNDQIADRDDTYCAGVQYNF